MRRSSKRYTGLSEAPTVLPVEQGYLTTLLARSLSANVLRIQASYVRVCFTGVGSTSLRCIAGAASGRDRPGLRLLPLLLHDKD